MTDDEEESYEEKPKTIRVEHVFKKEGADGTPQDFEPPQVVSGEGEKSTEEKLAEREAQLELLALKEFDNEKEKVLESVPDGKKAQISGFIGNDPNKLEMVRLQYGILDEGDDGTEAVPPKGHVRKPPKPKGNSEVQSNVIGELYKIRRKEATTPQEIAEQNVADQKIGELFEQMQDGLLDRPQGNNYNFQVAQCHICKTVLYGKEAKVYAETGYCSACGHKPKRRQ